MAKFRNVSGKTRSAQYGLPGERWVDPDDIITVSDEMDRKGRKGKDPKDRTGRTIIVLREPHTFSDSYRNQPTIWEEVLDTSAPPVAPVPEPAVTAPAQEERPE